VIQKNGEEIAKKFFWTSNILICIYRLGKGVGA
jgi:hypothetical protein